jgi:hypothetical protein
VESSLDLLTRAASQYHIHVSQGPCWGKDDIGMLVFFVQTVFLSLSVILTLSAVIQHTWRAIFSTCVKLRFRVFVRMIWFQINNHIIYHNSNGAILIVHVLIALIEFRNHCYGLRRRSPQILLPTFMYPLPFSWLLCSGFDFWIHLGCLTMPWIASKTVNHSDSI